MPIKRGGQTRSNAGRYAPEGQGATQRGRNIPTPSGKERPMQTARLPRANMPGTVTPEGAARSPQRPSGLSIMRDVMSVVGALRRFGPAGAASVAANEIMKARPTAAGTLTEARERGDYKPSQNMPNPQEGMTRAQSFDAAFADARKAGKKQFDWRGRTYTTQMK